ncbi:MAG TPA: TIGR01777 family oxidoreductase [Terracidiphilus sp.]|nr:TIGR01777 family oxidoreductase [Terracidiphilus sp.]
MDSWSNPQPVLLSGASGLLGAGIRHALEARGIPALRLVRSVPHQGQIAWNPVQLEPVADLALLEGCSAAIHLSGASLVGRRWTAAYRREMAASRIGSTLSLTRLLSELRQPPAVLAVASAIGIYGDRGDELLDESSAPGDGYLAELCSDWEAAAAPARAAGIRVVHLRFGIVLSRHGGALARMLPLFRRGLGGRLGSGRQWMSWISCTDAVQALLFALETSALRGPVNLTAPQPVRNAEFTRVLAQALQRRALLPAPALALRLVFGQMADQALLASTRVVPAALQSAGFRFAHATLPQALAAQLA